MPSPKPTADVKTPLYTPTQSYTDPKPSKDTLPFYRILSRKSTDSSTSVDALLKKDTKKTSSQPVSEKALTDCKLTAS
jgi:hypothetical protein